VAGSTETGSYTLNGDTTTLLETRNTGATYVLPSENEWYKAAYYNPSTGTYWTYPTQSYSPPSNAPSTIGTNNANYNASGYTDATNYLTQVGSFTSSLGPYGTYDMAGDVSQWNEAVVGSARGFRGGAWYSYAAALASSNRGDISPTYADYGIGFRVASVPEPSTVVLLLAALASLVAWRRVKK
jgi:formylglycine-generating enzyme required for sulfatase activity